MRRDAERDARSSIYKISPCVFSLSLRSEANRCGRCRRPCPPPRGCREQAGRRWDVVGCCLSAATIVVHVSVGFCGAPDAVWQRWDINGKDPSGDLLSPSTWPEDVLGMLLDPFGPHGAKVALPYRRCAHGDAGQCKLCVRFYLHGSLWQLHGMVVSGLSLQLSGAGSMHDYGPRRSAPRHACASDASLYRPGPYASHRCFQADFGLPAVHINVRTA